MNADTITVDHQADGILWRHERHVDLTYFTLAHLDIGDATTLYDPRLRAPWVGDLLDAYQRCSARNLLHALPLVARDEPHVERLLSDPPGPLGDNDGRRLCRLLSRARRAAAPRLPESFVNFEIPGWIGRGLAALRGALWDGIGQPPPLTVFHALSLGPRARGTYGKRQVVATDLTQDPIHVLIQLFHEETHPVTDRLVRIDQPNPSHHELEFAAVEYGAALIDRVIPDLAPAYRQWRARLHI